MKVRANNAMSGIVIRDTEVYRVVDNKKLSKLTVSETVLYPHQTTRGHKHPESEEVYVFLSGIGSILIDGNIEQVRAGDTVSMQAGAFHQVRNHGENNLVFISVSENYGTR